jgi:class 3 adenylate cyclase/DNA-binding XRE family transcriptional regulator
MPWPKLPKLSSVPRPFPPFGQQLRDHRTLRGLTIEEVAVTAGIAPQALREIESGTRDAPGVTMAKTLASHLKLDSDQRDMFLDSAEWESSMVGHVLGIRPEKPAKPPLLAAILVFVIADIRGYTHFTLEHGDESAALLTTQFAEIARAVVEQWGGQLVEVRGDEVLLVFASAQQAVKASHHLLLRSVEHSETHPDLPLAIGIGIDVGEAVEVDGGYRGIVINRAARLCSMAGAGEVLVSTGLAYLAPQVEGVVFVSRGQEQLKGLTGPTPILLAAPVQTMEVSAADGAPGPYPNLDVIVEPDDQE